MLILDNREIKLIDLIRTNAHQTQITTENLAIGDIIIRHEIHDKNMIYEIIIERKCMTDMIASIKDGRYREQKIRLLAERQNNTINKHVKIAYLIEGSSSELRLSQDKVMLNGSIISSIFRDDIPILRTYSLQETWELISRLHDRINKDYLDFFPPITNLTTNAITNPEQHNNTSTDNGIIQSNIHFGSGNGASSSIDNNYLASVKKNKKDNITPQLWNQLSLCAIPGVSNTIAMKITEKYPTIKFLLQSYNNCNTLAEKESLLSEIILTETDKTKRRLGNVVSKRIYEYLAS